MWRLSDRDQLTLELGEGPPRNADELTEPGKLEITVVNPPPGGGTSDLVIVDVNPPVEP